LSSGSRGRCRRFGLEEVAVVVVGCGDVEQRGEGGTGEVLGSFLRLNCACCSGCNWKRSDLVADFPGNQNKIDKNTNTKLKIESV